MGLYSDEGLSATSTSKRVGLLRMLEDARQGKFDIIVVKNLSRLSRNLMDCMNIIYELRGLPRQVGILFETENMFTLDKSVDFTLQVLSLVAQEEEIKESLNWLGTLQEMAEKGHCPRCGAELENFRRHALSRYANVTVCDLCEVQESLEAAGLCDKKPLAEWYCTKEWKL